MENEHKHTLSVNETRFHREREDWLMRKAIIESLEAEARSGDSLWDRLNAMEQLDKIYKEDRKNGYWF